MWKILCRSTIRRNLIPILLVCLLAMIPSQTTLGQKYNKRIVVDGPSELDWKFAAATEGHSSPSPQRLNHPFESNQQSYEFYDATDSNTTDNSGSATRLPLILFISNQKKSVGWKYWSTVCRKRGFCFAGPHGTYKGAPDSQSIRIVLEVLHDVRKKHPIDPERTYLSGFHGGGRIAAKIGYRLPELIGGILPISQGTTPPDEPWMRRRISERLSVAHLVASRGQGVPAHRIRLVTMVYHPQIASTETRCRLWRFPRDIQAMPESGLLDETIQWLDDGALQRRALASELPSTSYTQLMPRKEHARRLFADATHLLTRSNTTFTGMLMLKSIQHRFSDLPVAHEAGTLYADFEQRDGPWQKEMAIVQRQTIERKISRLRPKMEVDPPRWNVDKPTELLPITNWIAPAESQGLPSVEFGDEAKRILRQLSNRKELSKNGHLVSLDLTNSRVTTTQLAKLKQQFAGMQSLRAINFSGATMKESALIQIGDLTELQAIGLAKMGLTDQGMSYLSNITGLRFLSMESSRVTHAGLSKVGSLGELRALILGRSAIDDRTIAMLATKASKLEVLNLSSTRVTNRCAGDIAKLTSLTHLNLSNTKIGNTVCKRLRQLESLNSLILDDTRVTDAGIQSISDLPKLVRLSLLRTKVTSKSLTSIQRLPSLRKLNLRRTSIRDKDLEAWLAKRPELEVKWEGNRTIGIEEQKRRLLSELLSGDR